MPVNLATLIQRFDLVVSHLHSVVTNETPEEAVAVDDRHRPLLTHMRDTVDRMVGHILDQKNWTTTWPTKFRTPRTLHRYILGVSPDGTISVKVGPERSKRDWTVDNLVGDSVEVLVKRTDHDTHYAYAHHLGRYKRLLPNPRPTDLPNLSEASRENHAMAMEIDNLPASLEPGSSGDADPSSGAGPSTEPVGLPQPYSGSKRRQKVRTRVGLRSWLLQLDEGSWIPAMTEDWNGDAGAVSVGQEVAPGDTYLTEVLKVRWVRKALSDQKVELNPKAVRAWLKAWAEQQALKERIGMSGVWDEELSDLFARAVGGAFYVHEPTRSALFGFATEGREVHLVLREDGGYQLVKVKEMLRSQFNWVAESHNHTKRGQNPDHRVSLNEVERDFERRMAAANAGFQPLYIRWRRTIDAYVARALLQNGWTSREPQFFGPDQRFTVPVEPHGYATVGRDRKDWHYISTLLDSVEFIVGFDLEAGRDKVVAHHLDLYKEFPIKPTVVYASKLKKRRMKGQKWSSDDPHQELDHFYYVAPLRRRSEKGRFTLPSLGGMRNIRVYVGKPKGGGAWPAGSVRLRMGRKGNRFYATLIVSRPDGTSYLELEQPSGTEFEVYRKKGADPYLYKARERKRDPLYEQRRALDAFQESLRKTAREQHKDWKSKALPGDRTAEWDNVLAVQVQDTPDGEYQWAALVFPPRPPGAPRLYYGPLGVTGDHMRWYRQTDKRRMYVLTDPPEWARPSGPAGLGVSSGVVGLSELGLS